MGNSISEFKSIDRELDHEELDDEEDEFNEED